MRRRIVAGNWKMNTTPAQGQELIKAIAAEKTGVCDCVEMIIGVPFTHICAVGEVAKSAGVAVAAQNCSDEKSGAFTGEISAEMLASVGVQYVILGHSERREYFCEDSAELTAKLERVYENGMAPIYCIGEKLEEREANQQEAVCRQQLEEVVFSLTPEQFSQLVIAYEPVWAIGTGKTATSDQAQEIHAFIRSVLAEKFGTEAAAKTPILYGGSCNAGNAQELFSKEDVDGGLIGGASLAADTFVAIAKSFEKR